jgi:quercetin dioxygenase-like cupin family protein
VLGFLPRRAAINDGDKKMTRPALTLLMLFAALILTPHPAQAADAAPMHEVITPAFRYPLPNVPGKTILAVVVDYAPGAKTMPHRHGAAFVIGYVLAGAVRSQIDDGPVQVYHAGESWSERPHAHHKVSENASDTEPAKLLAIFIVDTKFENHLMTLDKK